MRVLVTSGSKLGGTAGIADTLAAALRDAGHDVVVAPAEHAPPPAGFDAAVIGGAIYANRWHAGARRYVERHAAALRAIPTWLFSSGPLDDSATRADLPPPRQVRALMDRIGAIGHVTFGGRLEATARGFPAAAMAKEHAGDWRDPERIRAWGAELARALPTARPGAAVELHGRSLARALEYGAVGWALYAALTVPLLAVVAPARPGAAVALHAVLAPLVFAVLAVRYQAALGARAPLPTALGWAALAGVLDLAVLGPTASGIGRPSSVTGFWLPLGLAALAAWLAGAIAAMAPFPKAAPPPGQPAAGHAR